MNDCALIIFAKLPLVGEVKTRLGKSIGMKEAAEVYKQFAERAFILADAMKSLGATIHIFFVQGPEAKEMAAWVGREFRFVEQVGENLGGRMENAFKRTFADGAKRSVIIGTDVPELDSSILDSAFQGLHDHDVVLGPSKDGGYYLLGMESMQRVFDGIQWSADRVFRQTLDRFHGLSIRIHCFRCWQILILRKTINNIWQEQNRLEIARRLN